MPERRYWLLGPRNLPLARPLRCMGGCRLSLTLRSSGRNRGGDAPARRWVAVLVAAVAASAAAAGTCRRAADSERGVSAHQGQLRRAPTAARTSTRATGAKKIEAQRASQRLPGAIRGRTGLSGPTALDLDDPGAT